jgi:hypothetical protein
LGSIENNFVYALMGNINLMLYPYITTVGTSTDGNYLDYWLKPTRERLG